jgi:hypothetical protein
MSKLKTLDNTKFYIQYLDLKGDKITLSFRNEKSFDKHILNSKISKDRIIYKSYIRPRNAYTLGSFGNGIKSNVNFFHTTKRSIGGA